MGPAAKQGPGWHVMTTDTVTDAERERLETIRRNRERLRQLGIEETVGAIRAIQDKLKPKRKRTQKPPPRDGERRSQRIRGQDPVVYTTFELDEEFGDHTVDVFPKATGYTGEGHRPVRRKPSSRSGDVLDGDDKGEATVARRQSVRAAPAPGSSKATNADVASLLAECLGRLVRPPEGSGAMKATAMARMRGSNCREAPRHNKYSGIQEWANAVALFVNVVGKAGSDYTNTFTQGGRCMRWFAQPTHDEDHPVVQRLSSTAALLATDKGRADEARDGRNGASGLEEGRKWRKRGAGGVAGSKGGGTPQAGLRQGGEGGGAAAKEETGAHGVMGDSVPADAGQLPETVVLFLRREGEPYVCCGRVAAAEVDASVRPITFLFKLLDFDALAKEDDFRDLMGGVLDC